MLKIYIKKLKINYILKICSLFLSHANPESWHAVAAWQLIGSAWPGKPEALRPASTPLTTNHLLYRFNLSVSTFNPGVIKKLNGSLHTLMAPLRQNKENPTNPITRQWDCTGGSAASDPSVYVSVAKSSNLEYLHIYAYSAPAG